MHVHTKLLQKIHLLTQREWARAASEEGLSLSEHDYLSAVQAEEDRQRIENHHGQHLQDIVDALGVSKASASAMITKLEKLGLVERFQCRLDARAQHIVLTSDGQIKLARGQKVYERIAKQASEELATLDISGS